MKVIEPFLRILLAGALVIMVISCASSPYVQKESEVLELVALINDGEATNVDGLLQTPFALDTETLYLDSDVTRFWDNLAENGFAMSNPGVIATERVGEETYRKFADTFDMKNFFAQYTGEDTSLVTVGTGEGSYYFLLERAIQGYPRIRGFKGPVR